MRSLHPGRVTAALAFALSLSLSLSFSLAGPGPAAAAPPLDWKQLETEALATLTRYVRIDTSNPPGDTRQTADLLAGLLADAGLPVTRYESAPGKAMLFARLPATVQPPRGKPILLLHHMDVVPADAARWPVPPFAAVLRDGHLWGRGAIDMKGLGVMHLYAFLALQRAGGARDRDVILLAVPDEEAGGRLGTRFLIDKHYAELDPEYVLDEGGCGSRDLYTGGKLVYGISVAEKKLLWLRVRAEGTAGHGSQPHDQNPNDRLVRALARLLEDPMPPGRSPLLEAMRARIGPLAQNKFARALDRTTIALTTLRAGVGEPPKVNVIPSWAEATLDCRLLPGVSAAAFLDDLKQRLGDPGLQISVTFASDDPVVTPTDTPLYRALEAAIVRASPGAVVAPILVPFGTDSNALRPRGVKSYGVLPALLPAAVMASMHGDGERLPVAELGRGTRILFEALRETLAPGAR